MGNRLVSDIITIVLIIGFYIGIYFIGIKAAELEYYEKNYTSQIEYIELLQKQNSLLNAQIQLKDSLLKIYGYK